MFLRRLVLISWVLIFPQVAQAELQNVNNLICTITKVEANQGDVYRVGERVIFKVSKSDESTVIDALTSRSANGSWSASIPVLKISQKRNANWEYSGSKGAWPLNRDKGKLVISADFKNGVFSSYNSYWIPGLGSDVYKLKLSFSSCFY